jgi:hypothetical protein
MIKKNVKKLVITKETLRELTDQQIGQAAGGAPWSYTDPTCYNTCFCQTK